MDRQQILNLWKQFNHESKPYFQTYSEAVHIANAKCSGHCKYGEECTDADYIGEWCQEFWDALPDELAIRQDEFFRISDIAEWWCFGD